MGINPERGEAEITLGGRAYPMLPTTGALTAIEQQIGRALMALVMNFQTSGMTLRETSIIVREAIHAAGRDRNDKMLQGLKLEKIEALILDEGLFTVSSFVLAFVLSAINGGVEDPKKKDESEPRSH